MPEPLRVGLAESHVVVLAGGGVDGADALVGCGEGVEGGLEHGGLCLGEGEPSGVGAVAVVPHREAGLGAGGCLLATELLVLVGIDVVLGGLVGLGDPPSPCSQVLEGELLRVLEQGAFAGVALIFGDVLGQPRECLGDDVGLLGRDVTAGQCGLGVAGLFLDPVRRVHQRVGTRAIAAEVDGDRRPGRGRRGAGATPVARSLPSLVEDPRGGHLVRCDLGLQTSELGQQAPHLRRGQGVPGAGRQATEDLPGRLHARVDRMGLVRGDGHASP
nr:hypothetical protein [Aeromicrobium sp. SORGH_AS_0981]